MAGHEHGEHVHIRCRTIIEILGKPKEHVEDTLKTYVGHIKKDNELIVLKEEFSEIKEQGNLWSKFVELDLVVKGTKKLIGFCFEYMPSSIEVIKPENYSMTDRELSNFLNDLQARLHGVDMIVKQQKTEMDFLKKNMHTIINNAIIISLRFGKMGISQLSKITGVDEKELGLFTEGLLQNNRIKKEGDLFVLSDGH